jgi:hypothetical protein
LTAPKPDRVYELRGPRIYTYRDLIRTIADQVHVRPFLVSVPVGAWQTLGFLMELMARPLVTRSQVELMAIDNVASPECPGLRSLGIEPRPIDSMWSQRRIESDG